MTIDPITKARAMKLLGAGMVTAAEVGWLLGISRQAVQKWCDRANVDPVTARETYLRRLLKR